MFSQKTLHLAILRNSKSIFLDKCEITELLYLFVVSDSYECLRAYCRYHYHEARMVDGRMTQAQIFQAQLTRRTLHRI